MKLSDYVAKFIAEYTDHVFTGTGGCIVHVLDSLHRLTDVQIIPGQNEQGAAIAAEAYSRVTNKIGVSLATSGPGIINLFQGIACAYYDSIPTLYITGDVPTSQLKNNDNIRQLGFQEMDVVGMLSRLSKYCTMLTDPRLIRYELEKMVYMATTGRQGPVVFSLPDDLQRAEITVESLVRFDPPRKFN